MTDDWKVFQERDLPEHVWQYLDEVLRAHHPGSAEQEVLRVHEQRGRRQALLALGPLAIR